MRVGQRVVGGDEHALPTAIGVFGMVHWMRRVEIVAEQVSVFVKIPARRDGYDEFASSAIAPMIGLMTLSIWYGLMAMMTNVGRRNDFGRVVQRAWHPLHRGFSSLS